MNKKEEELKQLFDSLRKVLFYVGHGKYNDYMSTEEVQEIKSYTFQYLIFCYKRIFEATREEKLTTSNAIKVIFKSMLNNVNLVSINNIKWLIRNK